MSNPGAPLGRSVTAAFTPLPADAAAAPLRAAARAGEMVAQYGAALGKAEDQSRLVDLRTQATKQLDDLRASFRTDEDPATAEQRFSDSAQGIYDKLSPALRTPAAQTAFKAQFSSLSEPRRVAVGDMAFQRLRQTAVANLADAIDVQSRSAAYAHNESERAAALASIHQSIDDNIKSGMIGADTGAAMSKRVLHRLALYDGHVAVDADPRAALQALKGGAFADLDPLDRQSLIERADAQIKVEAREARAALRDARATARLALQDMDTVVAQNLPVSQDVLDATRQAVAKSGDKSLAVHLAHSLRSASIVESLRKATPREVEGAVADLSGMAEKHGADASMAAAVKGAQAKLTHMNSALSKDPLSYAAEEGVVPLAPLKLDGSDTPDAIQMRVHAADIAAQHYGVNVPLLTASEENQFKDTLDREEDPKKKLAALAALTHTFGDRAAPELARLAPDQPALSVAGHLLLEGPRHVSVARDIVTGEAALKARPELKPNRSLRSGWSGSDAAINLNRAMALTPERQAAVFAAADAIYAARAPAHGVTGTDANGGDGTKLYEQAIQAAVGAQYDATGTQYGGMADYRGNAVIIPGTIATDGFENLVHHIEPSDLSAASVTGAPPLWNGKAVPHNVVNRTWLVNAGMRAGARVYALSTTNPAKGTVTPLRDANGQPFRFDFSLALARMQARATGGIR